MMRYLFGLATAVPLSGFVLAAASDAVFAQATTNPNPDYGHHHGSGMMWGGGHWGGLGMGFGFIFMLILLVAVVVAVIFVMRSTGVAGMPNLPGGPVQSGDNAVSILKERFAKGEIDKDEFEEKRKLLE